MDLTPYFDGLRHQMVVAAEAGGDDARSLAERLAAPLESAMRLALLDVLSAAADEITRDLAPGSVELRLRGREPSFVVTPAPADRTFEEPRAATVAADGEDGVTARINFRLGEGLKGRIEEAAGRAGLSVNAWLVRAATTALEPVALPTTERGGSRYRGWAR